MKTEKQKLNRNFIVNKCADAIAFHLQNTDEVSGFTQHIIVTDGGHDKYCRVDILLNTTNPNTIKGCIEKALEIATKLNFEQLKRYKIKLSGFMIDFKITLDHSKYVKLENIDYSNNVNE